MFTGLIESVGSIHSLQVKDGTTRIVIESPSPLVQRLHTGDSVSVSGVCLTAIEIDMNENTFAADLAAETIARTSLIHLKPGRTINLELPASAGTPLGGHIVQGHVDGVGTLCALEPVSSTAARSTADWWLRLTIPENCARYVVEKGSIAIEGISLTVAHIEDSAEGALVTIAVIPHTYAATNLHTMELGSPLNIEVDVLAKYAERLASHKKSEFELTSEYLIANGY